MANTTPEAMKAWVFKKSGEPKNVLHLEENWPVPTPVGSQVLVKLHATSLNPIGWKAMGAFPFRYLSKTPAYPESDISGVIVGGKVEGTAFKVGDEVFGQIPYSTIMKTGKGTLAEYTVAEPTNLVKKPDNISHEEAASYPLSGLTAHFVLVRTGGLKHGAGQRVFINGGSGGVGVYAIQLAKAYGAFVVTTCSPSSKAFVESLGPDEMIDYRSVDLAAHLKEAYSAKEKQFDIFFDTIGVQSLYQACPAFMKPKTDYLDINGPHMHGFLSLPGAGLTFANRLLRPQFLGGSPVKYKFLMLPGDTMGAELQESADFFRDGKLKPKVDKVFEFSDAIAAYEKSMSGRAQGKVVIRIA